MSESIQNTYLKKYANVWDANLKLETNFKEVLERGFVFQYDSLEKSPDILFLGINPAYGLGAPSERTVYSNVQDANISYFRAFQKVIASIKDRYENEATWTHLDLCAFRETQQSFIRETLFKTEKGVNFILDQINIAKEILEEINPKVIVCSNTMAKHLLGRDKFKHKKTGDDLAIWLGYEFEFNEELGTDIMSGAKDSNPNFTPSPIFFTSMLSGQRALDNGSRERLIWHINKALEWLS